MMEVEMTPFSNLKEANRANQKLTTYLFEKFWTSKCLRAELDYSTGDCVISMDGDLQHPPELIPDLIDKWKEGYDIVYTIREDSKNLFFKGLLPICFMD